MHSLKKLIPILGIIVFASCHKVTYKTLWSHKFEKNVFFELVDDRIFCGSSDSCISAINKQTGKTIWKLKIDGDISSQIIKQNNVLYFGAWKGSVFAVNKQNGKIIWQYKTEKGFSSGISLFKNSLFFGNQDSCTYCLDIITSNCLWKMKMEDNFPALIDTARGDAELVDGKFTDKLIDLVIVNGFKTYIVNPSTGKIKNSIFISNGEPAGFCSLRNNILYISFSDHIVMLITNEKDNICAIPSPAPDHIIFAAPAVTDDLIFFSIYRKGVFAYRRLGSARIWEHLDTNEIHHYAIFENKLFLGVKDGTFCSLDLNSGKELSNYKMPAGIIRFMNDKDVFYISCINKTLYALKEEK